MGAFLLGLVLGGNLLWAFMSLRRDDYWREFNARRRGSNPPPPAPGMRREYLWSPFQMAECGGPCWEAQDPRRCDCGALWRDVPATPTKPQPHGGRQLPNLP